MAVPAFRIVSEVGWQCQKAADDVGHFGAEFTKLVRLAHLSRLTGHCRRRLSAQVAAGATALAAVAGPALGAVMLGVDGIKEVAHLSRSTS